jgi:hypothetical protein
VSQDQLWGNNNSFNLASNQSGYSQTPSQPVGIQQKRFISRHPNTTNIFTSQNTVEDSQRSRRAHFAQNRQSSHETLLYQHKQPHNLVYLNTPQNQTPPPITPPANAFNPTQDFRYVTDVTPRSRRPIHILVDNKTEAELREENNSKMIQTPTNPVKPETTSQLIASAVGKNFGGKQTSSASDFWRKIDNELVTNRSRPRDSERQNLVKQRSVSSSRALELANKRNETLNRELDCLMGRDDLSARRNERLNKDIDCLMGRDEVDNVVSAKLCIAHIEKPDFKSQQAVFDQISRVAENISKKLHPTNKYEEHVVKNITQAAAEPNYRRSPSKKQEEKIVVKPSIAPVIESQFRRSPLEEQPTVKSPTTPSGLQRKSPFDTLRTVVLKPESKIEVVTPLETSGVVRKGGNLDEAINELEAIYKSLKLSDEELLERATRKDISTPTLFDERRLEFDDDDDDDRNDKEPDIVLDDLSYRNLKHANSALKVLDNQPPFGIPIGPVPPSPGNDYLQVAKPKLDKPRFMPQKTPDLIADDLAVRNLRKDNDQLRSHNPLAETDESGKKKRAFRSLSANIQSLIVQKESAKPSGGDYDEFEFFLAKQLENEREKDVPSTVYAVPAVRPTNFEQPLRSVKKNSPKSSPSENRGAVFNLPSTLKSPSPSDSKSGTTSPTTKRYSRLSLPKSVSPDVVKSASRNKMEDILNAIALEAKATSEKLGKDLIALRKETSSVSKLNIEETKPSVVRPSPVKPFGDLVFEKPMQKTKSKKMVDEIDEVAKAAKLCEDILKNVVEEKQRARRKSPVRMVREIEHTSDAAKVCEKLLKDVVTASVVTTQEEDVAEIANIIEGKEPLEAQKAVHKKLSLDMSAERERNREPSESPVISKPVTPKTESKPFVVEAKPVSKPTTPKTESKPFIVEAKSPLLKLTLKTETYQFEIPDKTNYYLEETIKPKIIAAKQKSNSLEHIEEIGPDYDNLRSDFEKNISKPRKSLQPMPAELPDYANLQSRSVKSSSPTAEVVKPMYTATKNEEEIDQIMKEYSMKAECQNLNEAICNKIGEKLKHAILNETSCTDDDKHYNMIELASKTSSSLDLSDTKTTPYSTPKETISPLVKSPRSQTPAGAFNDHLRSSSKSQGVDSSINSETTRTTMSNEPKSSTMSNQPANNNNSSSSTAASPQIEFIDVTPAADDESLYNSAEELAMIFGMKSSTPPKTIINKGKSKDNNMMCADVPAFNTITTKITQSSSSEHGYINLKNTKISLCNNLLIEAHWQDRGVKSVQNLDTIVETHEEFVDFDCNNEHSNNNNNPFSSNISNSSSLNNNNHSPSNCVDSEDIHLFKARHPDQHDNNDSGNVSLSDFVDYAVDDDDCATVLRRTPKEPTKNEILNIDCLLTDEDQRNSLSMMDEFDEIYAQCEEEVDENFDDGLFEDILNEEVLPASVVKEVNNNDINDQCRQRRSQSNETSPPPQRSTVASFFSSTAASSKSFLGLRNRDLLQPQHVILACSYGLANYDYLTLVAIIIAIITLFALLLL